MSDSKEEFDPKELWISSTAISRRIDCDRKFRYDLDHGINIGSDHSRWGNLYHDAMQAYVHFDMDSMEGLEAAMAEVPTGDYGENELPHEAFYEDALLGDDEEPGTRLMWPDVKRRVEDTIGSEHFQTIIREYSPVAEKNVYDWKVPLGDHGTVGHGHIDLFHTREDGTPVVSDYKTRGSLGYAPRTAEDFKKFPQTAYYASLVYAHAKATGEWEPAKGVVVAHINVVRDSTGYPPTIYSHHYSPAYLESCLNYFNMFVNDAIEDARKAPEDVEPNRASCYKYGKPCPYYDNCPAYNPHGYTGLKFLIWHNQQNADKIKFEKGEEMNPNSPQCGDRVLPTPIPEKEIDVLDGVTPRPKSKLHGVEVYTLAQLVAYIMEHGGLDHLSYVGKVTEGKIAASLAEYWVSFEDATAEEMEVLNELAT